MDLSIIIVSYNTREFISACLNSIKKYLDGLPYEIIVVDNHSVDGTSRLIHEDFPDVSLIENGKNLGFGRAVNEGYKKAGGKYLLILNPDVEILPGSVEKMIHFLEGHPEVGLLLPKLVNPDGSLQFSCRTFYDFLTLFFRKTPLGKAFPNHKIIRKHLMLDWDHREPREVDWGLGACMFLRRDALGNREIFDERFFLYFEDVDLCLRLKKEGWKVVYYPEAVMIHSHLRHSAKGVFSRAKWEHLKSLIKFYFKHRRFSPPAS
jgi:GT2 family glycosyltransferase